MRRSSILLAGIIALAAAGHAAAAPARSITTIYYLHAGSLPVGDANAATASTSAALPMDATKPSGSTDSVYAYGGGAGQPVAACPGDPKALHPTWTGLATGSLTAKLTLTLYSRSAPGGGLTVRLYTDLGAACPVTAKPVASFTTGELPETPEALPYTVVLRLPHPIPVRTNFTIALDPTPTLVPGQASVLDYDSTTSPSNVVWSCVPARGQKHC